MPIHLQELKVRLRSLYASGGNLTTLQILFDSTSLYDFSMRSEAMKTITKHDRELMERIRALPHSDAGSSAMSSTKKKRSLPTRRKTLKRSRKSCRCSRKKTRSLSTS